jgi:hypothetical protein
MNDEDFLSRWSRRKHAAEEASSVSLPSAPVSDPPKEEDARSAMASEVDSAGELDLSALPPLDSITSATDVTAFLRKGVPQALTREALRRAWAADPAIRDFVGLAENAWDFNDPNAMHGFGPLDYTPEQVRELVAKIVGDVKRVVEDGPSSAAPQQQDVVMSSDMEPAESSDRKAIAAQAESAVDQAENSGGEGMGTSPAVPQSSTAGPKSQADRLSVVYRSHGSALPR